jgi:dihydrofolate reductase
MLSLIVAMDKNRGIGVRNSLPWYLPKDLKYFQKMTTGNIVIMGRKTYESIGRPLPNRINVVISKTLKETEGIIVSDDIESVLEVAKDFHGMEVFVIGGGQLFHHFLGIADRLYITEIDAKFPTDTKFPYIHDDEWVEVSREEDRDMGYNLNFIVYDRA